MTITLGAVAPDFTAETTFGTIRFHEWIGHDWCVLFSHPKDFTPVCTTELGSVARLLPEFQRRGVKVIGLGVDPVSDHLRWSEDIAETQGTKPNYPIIGDRKLEVSKLYGMLPATAGDSSEGRTASDNFTVRGAYVIGPDKIVKLAMTYPMSTGRNFQELLRVIDSLQLTEKHKVGTPAGWQRGDEVLLLPSLSNDEARKRFPNGWRAPKPYMRFVDEPV